MIALALLSPFVALLLVLALQVLESWALEGTARHPVKPGPRGGPAARARR